jgi:hypothetical protein
MTRIDPNVGKTKGIGSPDLLYNPIIIAFLMQPFL